MLAKKKKKEADEEDVLIRESWGAKEEEGVKNEHLEWDAWRAYLNLSLSFYPYRRFVKLLKAKTAVSYENGAGGELLFVFFLTQLIIFGLWDQGFGKNAARVQNS